MSCVFLLIGNTEHAQAASKGSRWSHTGADGQALWGKEFPDCGRKAQSPINIQTQQVKYDPTLGPIELEGYEDPEIKWFTLANNGHTVEMALPSSLGITAQGQHYSAVQLHFHWGSSQRLGGSEHQVNGEALTAELHVVHYNAEKYPNISVALDKADGLAVLAILLEVGQTRNAAYDYILSYLQYIKYKGQKIMIPTFSVQRLLPKQLDKYYTYHGSLTTPPCFQSVLWIIFHQKVLLSPDQFENLITQLYSSGLEVSDNIPLIDNVRMVQPLNHRVVKASFHVGWAVNFRKAMQTLMKILASKIQP
uniref:carbonic anhydrase n=1 Tax=Callorhinchus milii TaxID=7868 RepID=V9KZL8_CALMI